jgi:uncharacterized SAM-binding protein YcdF (DUF218 family)
MFFVLSKVLGFFAAPSNLLIMGGIVGVLLLPTRFARAGRRLMAAAILLLALFGFLPLGDALILPLEQRFPAWQHAGGAPDGIVVLGGAVVPTISEAHQQVSLSEAAERITAAVELARRYPSARIVFSGGSGSLASEISEATFAGRLLENLGVAPGRVVLEERSRNTAENAAFSKVVADPKPGERWLLVTSASHMPRAIGCFRRAGFDIEAYPVDWRTRGFVSWWRPFFGASEFLWQADVAVREWVGLIIYRLTGRTSELLPGPQEGAR